MITKKKAQHHRRLKRHIRKRVSGTPDRPRMTVYRSLRHIYAQIVDDTSGRTLVAVSDLSKGFKEELKELKLKELKGRTAIGRRVGELAASMALERNIKKVVFDRSGYLYHGLVKAMADGARKGGLEF